MRNPKSLEKYNAALDACKAAIEKVQEMTRHLDRNPKPNLASISSEKIRN